MATCLSGWKELLGQETRFLFLSLTAALALQRAWPGSSPVPRWAPSTPSSVLPRSFATCATGHSSACRSHEGCSELTCCCARDSLWSPNRLRGPIHPCTPCPDSLQQVEPVQPPSARMEMGTVLTPALAGRALESAANAAQWPPDSIEVLQGIKLELSLQSSCPSYRICVPVLTSLQ